MQVIRKTKECSNCPVIGCGNRMPNNSVFAPIVPSPEEQMAMVIRATTNEQSASPALTTIVAVSTNGEPITVMLED